MKASSRQSKSVVLSRVNYNEADLIVTFLTREHGKISGIAKHGRKSVKRFGNVLTSLSVVELDYTIQRNRDLVRLNHGELIRVYENIALDINRLGLAGYALELVDNFLAPYDPAQEVFDLLLWMLDRLNVGERTDETTLIFLTRILNHAGFGPNVLVCPKCSMKSGEAHDLVLRLEEGGVICKNCAPSGFQVSKGTLKLVSLIQKTDIQKLDRVRAPRGVLIEIMPFLKKYVNYTLGKELKSAHFLNQLKKAGAA